MLLFLLYIVPSIDGCALGKVDYLVAGSVVDQQLA